MKKAHTQPTACEQSKEQVELERKSGTRKNQLALIAVNGIHKQFELGERILYVSYIDGLRLLLLLLLLMLMTHSILPLCVHISSSIHPSDVHSTNQSSGRKTK